MIKIMILVIIIFAGNIPCAQAVKRGILKSLNHNTASSSFTPQPEKKDKLINAPATPAQQTGTPASVKPAIDVKSQMQKLDSNKAKERIEAIDALGNAGAKESESKLLERLTVEKDEGVKIHMLNSLGSVGGPESVKRLKAAAREDISPDVRAASCSALGSTADKSSIEPLEGIMSNENEKPNVRVCAAASLIIYFIEEPGVRTAIENVLTGSEKRAVRFGLVDNLKHIAGKTDGKYLLGVAKNDKDAGIKALAIEILKENETK
jgi:HEAT repeat protein